MKEDQCLAHDLSVGLRWNREGVKARGSEQGYVEGMTSRAHFSKNRITGIKECVVARYSQMNWAKSGE